MSSTKLYANDDVVSTANPLPVIGAVTTAPAAPVATSSGFSNYRKTDLGATKDQVKATAGNIYGFKFINPNTVPVYVKIYNAAAAAVTVGTTVPQHVIPVPAGDGTTPGVAWQSPGDVPAMSFDTGITLAAVTGLADNSSAAPGTALNAEAQYK